MSQLPKKVELGCGSRKKEGFLGIDICDTKEADIIQNLDEEDWDIPDDYFKKIRSDQVFEHLEKPYNFFSEIYRIAEDGAEVVTITPHSSSQAWQAPDHKRLVSFEFPYHYLDGGYRSYRLEKCDFNLKKCEITFSKRKMFLWNYLVEPLVNINYKTKLFYEKTFLSRMFPAQNLYFVLEVEK